MALKILLADFAYLIQKRRRGAKLIGIPSCLGLKLINYS